VSHGWVSNLTTNVIEGPVEWECDPVLVTPEGYPVLQFLYWSAGRNAWVCLVREHTGRAVQAGVVEVTLDMLLGLEASTLAQGWTYNATTGQLAGPVDWGAWPAICTTRLGDRLYEVSFWSKELSLWVMVVAKKTGRQFPAGTIEISLDDVFRVQREVTQGLDVRAAVQKVVGSVPA
jgi:hypothetical protein